MFLNHVFHVSVVLLALSSIPGAAALPVCYTDSQGYRNCSYATWGVSLALLMLFFVFLTIFCISSHRYEEDQREETARMNLAYLALRRDYMATTYAPRYHPQPLPAQDPLVAAPASQTRRPRPSSLTEPFTNPYDRSGEPTYPATAYPFAGYSVVPPASHGPTKVHQTVNPKEKA